MRTEAQFLDDIFFGRLCNSFDALCARGEPRFSEEVNFLNLDNYLYDPKGCKEIAHVYCWTKGRYVRADSLGAVV